MSQNLFSPTLSVSQRLGKLLIVILLVSALGCRTGGPAVPPIETAKKEQSQLEPRAKDAALLTTPEVVMPPRCPSQDFDQYLKRFADPDRDDVRQAFTADPLEYDVPRYLIVDDVDEDAPLMYTTEISGAERSRYFFLRYFDKAGDYLDVGRDEAYLDSARAQGPSPYRTQMAVEALDNEDREVTVGFEYELDIFLFRRIQNCWYLSRATNARD